MKVFTDIENLPFFRNAVVTIGSYDGIHAGHQAILQRITSLTKEIDGESVVVTFEPHPRIALNPNDTSLRLLTTVEEKIELLKQYDIDNLVIAPFTEAFSEQSPISYIEDFLIEKLKANTIVIGYDHHFGKKRAGNIELLQQYASKGSFKVQEIPKQEIDDIAVSSTKIRQAIENGHLDNALQLLQHPYPLSGKVIKGDQIGRTLGYPTANLEPFSRYKLIPAAGIYAVNVIVGNRSFKGMLYIGTRPAISGATEQRIEVNIFDFNEDIYGQNITVELLAFLRHDSRFESLDALKLQLGEDKKMALLVIA